MTKIPILNGIYSDSGPDIRTSYPVNMVPVPKENGISSGYLRPSDGVIETGTGPGIGRGGINWNGECYRVMGSYLVKIDKYGIVTTLGDVGPGGPVTMDYSFDILAVASDGRLYYWDGSSLTHVNDTDLGKVVDFKWVAGYFIATDGTSLVVTDLDNPTSINPFKYGSSESDPDQIKAILKIRNEIYALNRYTIEAFENVGGDFFPFSRIDGAQIQRGVIGTHSCCAYIDGIVFLGSARNEPPGIYVGINATSSKISTREIDTILLGYTELELASVEMETRTDRSNVHIYVHLPDRTLVYDVSASKTVEYNVWFTLVSSTSGFEKYKAKNFVWCYDKWLATNPSTYQYGYMTTTTAHHWGSKVRWEFGTTIVYNGGMGCIFHAIELVALSGRVDVGKNPQISTSYSIDGETWSQDKYIASGATGDRSRRLVWRQQGHMRHWRVQRFRGDSDSHLAFLLLEAQIEPLAV